MGVQGQAVKRNFYDKQWNPRGRQRANQGMNKFNDLFDMYRDTLSELCANRFKWVGWPESVDVRFLERTLFQTALSVFYFEERYDQFLAMRASSAGAWNMYDNPTHFQVTGSSFISRRLPAAMCVPIWANYGRRPDTDIVNIYATKLANLDLTLEINANNARRTKVLMVTENQKLSGTNINDMLDRGDAIIPINKKVFEDGLPIETADLGVDPDQLVKLHMYKTRLWGEVMGLLGIDNSNQDKAERLVVAEVGANDGQVDNMRRVNLNAREQAVDRIKAKWPGQFEELHVGYWVDEPPADAMAPGVDTEDGGDTLDLGELEATNERNASGAINYRRLARGN
jgi:hypothetical protein